MSSNRSITWINDHTDRRLVHLRLMCLKALEEHSQGQINYYDFLLVAKALNFRFEESTHLMELRRFFFANGNNLPNKKLVSLLIVDQETLKDIKGDHLPKKMIIRFAIEGRIQAIKEVTNQDDDFGDEEEEEVEPYSATLKSDKDAIKDPLEKSQEYHEKLTIILSIKVSEMMKKINLLLAGIPEDSEGERSINILSLFDGIALTNIPYEVFKKGVVTLLKKLEPIMTRSKLTMSEEDIRAIFLILDEKQHGEISKESMALLLDETSIARKITRYYQTRVNQRMVKNTLFKLGKNSNSIQIYQVKSASLLEFKTIEDDLVQQQQNRSRQKLPRRHIPHFGPIKKQNLKQSPSKYLLPKMSDKVRDRQNHSSLTTYKNAQSNLGKQRQKIEQIIRSTKEEKRKVGNDTIANKLRKLFIHKVILPREKLLEEEKMKYSGQVHSSKTVSNKLIVKMV